MSKPIIFNTKTKKRLPTNHYELEKDIQKLVEKNAEEVFNIRLLESEYPFVDNEQGSGRMDSIGIDEDNRPVIIEYKLNNNENIISQSLYYLNWLANHYDAFENLVIKKIGIDEAQKIEFRPRAICIASDYGRYDAQAIKQIDVDISLCKYYVYGDAKELVAFEFINNIQEPTKKITNKIVRTNSTCYPTYVESYAKISEPLRHLIDDIEDYLLSLSNDISYTTNKFYKVFKNTINFCSITLISSSIYLWIKTPWKDDYHSLYGVENYANKGHLGCGDIKATIRSHEDFERVKPLILLAYEQN